VEAGEVACIATSGTASGSTESVRRAESVKRPQMPTKIQMNKMVPSKAAITLNDPAAVSSMDDGCSSVVALLLTAARRENAFGRVKFLCA